MADAEICRMPFVTVNKFVYRVDTTTMRQTLLRRRHDNTTLISHRPFLIR
jgi:hypothetical protein